MSQVYVVGALRSPIGTGRAKDSKVACMSPQSLAMQIIESLFFKVPVLREDIQAFRLGSVVSLKSESLKQAPAREIALRTGMFNASSSLIEKACSSGLRAIYEAVQDIKNDGANFSIGGGVDMMSNAPDGAVIGALTDPITGISMAELSDVKALEIGFTREEYDRYAFQSFERAKENILGYEGYMSTIFPGSVDLFSFHFDQNINHREVTPEIISNVNNITGCEITTYANASKYGDGCGMLMLSSYSGVRKYKMPVLAEFLSYAEHTEKYAKDFIVAPIGAVKKAVAMAKIPMCSVDSFWVNEAFPGVPLSFIDQIPEAHWDNVNPWGGAIALGHPLGATGAILAVNAICQARKQKQKYVVVTLCNAIAEATAMVFKLIYR